MKNRGFTLIELMVAMGIGSVVLLLIATMLVRGTSLFRTENDEINVQNDYQIIRNQVDQVLMEAKTLVIEYQGDDTIIYTGYLETGINRGFSTTNKTTERVIVYDNDKNTLYIGGDYATAKNPGNMISNMVANFTINIDSSCIKQELVEGANVDYCVNPVRVKLNIDMKVKADQTNNDISSEYSINLRNKLTKIDIYTTTDANDALGGLDNVTSYEVK